MTFLKRIKYVCENTECKTEAFYHTLEYDQESQKNKTLWFCRKHKPDYDIHYLPSGEFKKIVHVLGTNYIKPCNEKGELNV